jgi:hypothetical protein
MSLIECRNRCPTEEGQAVEFCQRVRDVIVIAVYLANPVHWLACDFSVFQSRQPAGRIMPR